MISHKLDKFRCGVVEGGSVIQLTIASKDDPSLGATQASSCLDEIVQNKLQIKLRAADDFEYICRRRLLLQRLRKLGSALAEVRSALPRFVKQPRVVDGDDRLGGKVLDQLD